MYMYVIDNKLYSILFYSMPAARRERDCCTTYLQYLQMVRQLLVDAAKEIAATYKFSMRKVVGLRTDRASVMASDLNGVNGLMTNDNPHLIFMHSVCHRI